MRAHPKLNTSVSKAQEMIAQYNLHLSNNTQLNEGKKAAIDKKILFLKTLYQLNTNGETYTTQFTFCHDGKTTVVNFDLTAAEKENFVFGVGIDTVNSLLKRFKVSKELKELKSPKELNRESSNNSSSSLSPVTSDDDKKPEKKDSAAVSPATSAPENKEEAAKSSPPIPSLESTQKPAATDDRTEGSAVAQPEKESEARTVDAPVATKKPITAQDIVEAIDEQYLNVRSQENYGFFARHFDFTRGAVRANIFKQLLKDNKNNETAVNIIAHALFADKNAVKLRGVVGESLGKINDLTAPEYFQQKISKDVTEGSEQYGLLNSVISALIYTADHKGAKLDEAKTLLANYVDANPKCVSLLPEAEAEAEAPRPAGM